MRFFRVQIAVMSALLIVLVSSVTMAAVGNLNGLIERASMDEKSLHQKVLEQIPNSEVAQSYHGSWVKMQKADTTRTSDISVRLVTTGE
ncbi:hypothetical protein [Bdellovibrio svalbardensis]|uniref:Methyl-accepting chemotaxis protein n=1 Tax=Bdellovibrio svalbardensis TaxID=2972972 RepID=A0ABT6DM43_9BACT|nr:hypothetical protein [Bdellovibrio svalbardensis]MDG0816886.1 hypothetical protein [Bdellovibrio svalbardensis]